jgi:hypothetical protein
MPMRRSMARGDAVSTARQVALMALAVACWYAVMYWAFTTV